MHCCVIKCRIPQGMSLYYGKHIIETIVYPTLDEFGYVLPEADIQQKIEEQYDQCEKQCTIAVFLNDEEAMKTACIRAEWKPLEASNTLNKKEKKALRTMRKRKRSEEPCHICLEDCKKPTTMECEHTFCYKCIEKWMAIKRKCPVCDKDINVSKRERKKRSRRSCRKTLQK